MMVLDYLIPRFGRFRDCIEVMHAKDINYMYSKENVINSFNKHTEYVQKTCPKDKLLVFEAKDGWEPLCKFLGVEVPKVPYPNMNDTSSFKLVLNLIIASGWIALFLLLGLGYYLTKRFIL